MSNNAEPLDDAIFAGANGYDDLDNHDSTGDRGDEVQPDRDGGEAESDAVEATDGTATETSTEEETDAEESAGEVEAEANAESGEQSDDQRTRQPEPRIPKHRFDEVNERRKAAEKRLAEFEKQKQADGQEPSIDFDFSAKEEAYMDAVLDGEKDKAKSIREEIRQAEQQLYRQQMDQASTSTREATKAELELNSTINELTTEYPVFDGQSENYDQNLTEEALDLFEGFKGRGYDPATAMRRAVRYVVRANDLDQSESEASPAAGKAGKGGGLDQHRATEEQGKRKAQRAAKQPPEPETRSTTEGRDVMNMSEEDFDKLSDQEIARMRGDFA